MKSEAEAFGTIVDSSIRNAFWDEIPCFMHHAKIPWRCMRYRLRNVSAKTCHVTDSFTQMSVWSKTRVCTSKNHIIGTLEATAQPLSLCLLLLTSRRSDNQCELAIVCCWIASPQLRTYQRRHLSVSRATLHSVHDQRLVALVVSRNSRLQAVILYLILPLQAIWGRAGTISDYSDVDSGHSIVREMGDLKT